MNTDKRGTNKDIFLGFIILLLLKFFDFIVFSSHFWLYILTFILFIFAIKRYNQKLMFKPYITIYTIGVLLSCISCYYINKQSIFATFVESYPYLGILSYFITSKIKIINLEEVIKKLGILFCISYLIQQIIYPTVLFSGALNEIGLEQSLRIRMAASALSFILFFYGLNHYLINRKPKFLYSTLLGIIPGLLMGFRSQLALLVLFTVIMTYHILKVSRRFVTYSITAIIIAITLYQIPAINERIDAMIERQESDQTFTNEDYIRFIEYEYYTENVFTTNTEKFFGGGTPIFGSKYFQEITDAFDQLLYWNDWGIIGLSWIIGVIPVAILIIIVIVSMLKEIPKQYIYLKYSLLFLLLCSIATSMEIYRNGNLIVVGLVLGLIEKVHLQHINIKHPNNINVK